MIVTYKVQSQEYRKLVYEHYLRGSYDFPSESYLRKALHSS